MNRKKWKILFIFQSTYTNVGDELVRSFSVNSPFLYVAPAMIFSLRRRFTTSQPTFHISCTSMKIDNLVKVF